MKEIILMKSTNLSYKYFLLLAFLSASLLQSKETGKNLLWQVDSDNSKVYLLGSVHLAKESIYPFSSVIEDAFEKSDYLCMEMNPDSVNPMELISRAMYQDSSKLENNVSAETFAKLDSFFTRHNIPKNLFNKYKPWFAVMTLMSLELVKNGYRADLGIDQYFFEKAKKNGKQVLELESIQMQIDMLDKGISNFSDAFVDFSLNDYTNSTEEVDKLLDMWKRGDAEGYEKYLSSQNSNSDNSEIMKLMLDDRNFKMADKINNYLKSGKSYFVVVGAGHLVGKNGIVKLLENLNQYKIKQL